MVVRGWAEGLEGVWGGTQGRQRKKSHLHRHVHACVLSLAGVSLQKLAGLPLSVCLFVCCLFVVDPWSCCLFIIRPPHCEDAASVRHSINNPESSHAIQEPRRPLSPTRNGAGLLLVCFIPTFSFSFHYFFIPP